MNKGKLLTRAFDLNKTNMNLDLKRLEFLNLDYTFKDRSIISLDSYKFICRFHHEFKHLLHGDDKQINSLTDLIISLGFNLEQYDNSIKKSIETIARSIGEKNRLLKQLTENFDFLKNQNEHLLQTVLQLKTLIPSKSLISELKFLLENNKPRTIEIETKRLVENFNNRALDFDAKIKQIEQLVAEVKHIIMN